MPHWAKASRSWTDSVGSGSELMKGKYQRLAFCAGIGVLVAAGVHLALSTWVRAPLGTRSLVPFVLAGMAGVLAGMRLSLRWWPAHRERYRLIRLSFLVGGLLVVVLLGGVQAKGLMREFTPVWAAIVSVGALATWLLAFAHERLEGRRIPTYTALIFGLCIAAITMQQGHYMHDALAGKRVRAWNAYHYYLGSKYFKELSYFDLYAATLAADDDWQAKKKATKNKKRRKQLKRVKDFRKINRARDMRDYRIKPREKVVGGFDRSLISKERLQELGADSRFFRRHMRIKAPGGWTNTFMDLGYNPAPPWTVVGTPLANLVPTGRGPYWILANSDFPLYVLSFLALWWAFGLRLAALTTLWVNAIQFNEARFTGGFLQYDWLASVAICFAFFFKGWYRSAGVALSWGAMTRVFPGFFVAPLIIHAAMDFFGWGRRSGENPPEETAGSLEGTSGSLEETGGNPEDSKEGPEGTVLPPPRAGIVGRYLRIARHRRAFLQAFSLACLFLFVGSHFTGRGLQTWPEWVEKIGRHSGRHAITSNQRIGVGRLALHQVRHKNFWGITIGKTRNIKLERAKPKKKKLQLFAWLLLLPALVRRRDFDGMVLMQFGVFVAVTLSRYYASTWALVFLLGAGLFARGSPRARGDLGPEEDAGSPVEGQDAWQGLLLGSVLLIMAAAIYAEPHNTPRYFMVNYTFYGMGCLICLNYILRDLRHWWRRRASAS